MTSQAGIQTIAKRILCNFSWIKSSQTMKVILLIEYKKRNIFLENLFLIPFKKTKIKHIAEWTFWNVIDFAVMICPSRVLSVQVSKCWLLASTLHEAFFFFLKKKGRSRTSLPVTFFAWFWKKNIFSHYMLLND